MNGEAGSERGPFMELIRAYTDMGTFGKWYDSYGNLICYTVERQWDDNKPFVSCIPEGEYYLSSLFSPKFGSSYCVHGNGVGTGGSASDSCTRYGIVIHAANKASELQGCIAPGMALGVLDGMWAVSNSRSALAGLNMSIAEEISTGCNSVLITHGGAW